MHTHEGGKVMLMSCQTASLESSTMIKMDRWGNAANAERSDDDDNDDDDDDANADLGETFSERMEEASASKPCSNNIL